jgi:hypothetical protein
MTLSTFIRTNPNRQNLTPVRAIGALAAGGRAFRDAAAAIHRALGVLAAYRAALSRLEAEAGGDLFDRPALWAELKSAAWGEALDKHPSRAKSD